VLKIDILTIGRDKDAWVSDGCAHFEKLLSRWAEVRWTVLSSRVPAAALSPDEIRRRQSALLTEKLDKGFTIALADIGAKLDSPALAACLEKWQARCDGRIAFVIGGAHGLDRTLLDRADFVLSLSPMTFSHQLVRLILLEQMYRAFSILHGTDYHK